MHFIRENKNIFTIAVQTYVYIKSEFISMIRKN